MYVGVYRWMQIILYLPAARCWERSASGGLGVVDSEAHASLSACEVRTLWYPNASAGIFVAGVLLETEV